MDAGETVGTVAALWRYPVKSMAGERLGSSEVSDRGLVGDRAYALIDAADGRVATAKNPRTWPDLFEFHAALSGSPPAGAPLPTATITLPDGRQVSGGQPDVDRVLSRALRREVSLAEAAGEAGTAGARSSQEYWPDLPGLDHRDTVTDFELPAGTFFDAAPVHVLTSATMHALATLYPDGRMEQRRFRPNVVVETPEGATGFVENSWVGRTLHIGADVELSINGPCPRCVMVTLKQGDLPKDSGILRTAAQHNAANVGVYASVVKGGQVHEGDAVQLS